MSEITCPTCNQKHQLVRFHMKRGKSALGVICNKYGATINGKYAERTHFIPINQPEGWKEPDGIPDVYSHAGSKEAREKGNLQLPMTIPTGKVERAVDLPRAPDPQEKALVAEIDRLLFKAASIDGQILKLETKRRQIKDEAKNLGAELSKLRTNQFKLTA